MKTWLAVFLKWAILMTGVIGDETTFEVYMPDAHRGKEDAYLATVTALPTDKTYYIVEFIPSASMEVVHHMELDMCLYPLKMGDSTTCMQKNIVYMWARNASSLVLPKGVGFKVGKDTPVQHLSLTMHFASAPDKNDISTKSLGVILKMTDEPLKKTAGVHIMLTGGRIEPGTRELFDVSCQVKENVEMHVFAYRTHTHDLGRIVSGYRVRSKHGTSHWTLIGKKDPRKPQMFYPVKEDVVIRKGDIIASRCIMENVRDHTVHIGATHHDEMCNFYSMYWVENDNHPQSRSCMSEGPPNYYWETDDKLDNIPPGANVLRSENYAM